MIKKDEFNQKIAELEQRIGNRVIIKLNGLQIDIVDNRL